jgi:excisionase family DNA binding protein
MSIPYPVRIVRAMNAIVGIETAARMSGLSVRHFRRLIDEDGLRVIRIGRRLFIVSADLSHWAKSRNLQVEAPEPQDHGNQDS